MNPSDTKQKWSDNNECRTIILSDHPITEDKFDGGHRKVAEAIASVVQSKHNSKAKESLAIGLEGSWGSGKSTVIELLKNALGNDPKHPENDIYPVLTFDAWAHQGDQLRRSFLERLIKFFNAIKPTPHYNREKWEKVALELAKKNTKAEETITPEYTYQAIWLSVATLFVPIGAVLLTKSFDETQIEGKWWLGFLMLMPILVAFLLATYEKWIVNRKNPEKKKSIFKYVRITTEHINTKTIETNITPEPTSIEFESKFNELMFDSVGKGTHINCITFVVDNLDRVAVEDALKIWSTLRTFMESCQKNKDDWSNKLCILVPYAPDAIRKLWEKDDYGHEAADSFLHKSFQIRFQVPPPVLTNWKQYLLTLLDEAFPDHNKTDFELVYQAYEALRYVEVKRYSSQLFNESYEGFSADNIRYHVPLAHSTWSPTPRDLKLFVNDLGALHILRGHEISLPHMAAYVIAMHRFRGKDFASLLLNGAIPGNLATIQFPDGIGSSFAALWYNTDKKRANQLLLRIPIFNAIQNNKQEELLTYKELDGFSEVLNQGFAEYATSWNRASSYLCDAMICLNETNLIKDNNLLKRHLLDAARKIDNWRLDSDDYVKSIKYFFEIEPDKEVAKNIFSKMLNEKPGLEDDRTYTTWVRRVVEILTFYDSFGLQKERSGEISFQSLSQNKDIFEVCSAWAKYDPERRYWSLLKLYLNKDTILEDLRKKVQANEFTLDHLQAIPVLKVLGIEDWSIFISTVIDLLRPEILKSPAQFNLNLALGALWPLLEDDKNAENPRRIASKGVLIETFAWTLKQPKIEGLAAICLYTHLLLLRELSFEKPIMPRETAGRYSPEGQPNLSNYFDPAPLLSAYESFIDFVSNPRAYIQISKYIFSLFCEQNKYQLLWEINNYDNKVTPLITYCLELSLEHKNIVRFLPPENEDQCYAYLDSITNRFRRDKIVTELIRECELEIELSKNDDSKEAYRNYIRDLRVTFPIQKD